LGRASELFDETPFGPPSRSGFALAALRDILGITIFSTLILEEISMTKAVVRKELERIEGVTRSWFEWTIEKGQQLKTLVVEIDCPTDPNMAGFRPGLLDAIEETAKEVLTNGTTMTVSYLRVVPRLD
jgi:hypothetical protein